MQAIRVYRNKNYVYSDDDSNSPSTQKYGKDFLTYNAEILKSGLGSDVKVYVKGQCFALHRHIISARSPVFRSMFATEMEEGQTMTANIDHYEVDVMTDLFEFIYTCRASNIETTVAELLGAANEYCVDDLEAKCVRCLFGKITNETALMIFSLAKKYNKPELETKSTEFIIEHMERIPKESLAEIPVEAIQEIMIALANRAKSSPSTKKLRLCYIKQYKTHNVPNHKSCDTFCLRVKNLSRLK